MRTLIVVIAFFLAVPVASGTFQPTREADFWPSTGFDLSQARRFFSDSKCRSSQALFTACQKAFQSAGQLLGDPQEFRGLNFDQLLKRVDELAASGGGPNRVSKELVFGAMTNLLLREFDPHAGLFPSEYLKSIFSNPVIETVGIGIEDEVNDAGLFVRHVYPQSPAQAFGLEINDQILSIDGERVLPGLGALKAMKRLAANVGQVVEIRIRRRSGDRSVRIPVGRLSLPSVTMEFAQLGKAMVAVAHVRTFAHGSCASLRNQLTLVKKRLHGLVLDLRNNLGGPIDEAACMMSLFTKESEFVVRKAIPSAIPVELGLHLPGDAVEQESWRQGLRATEFATLPMVVLVNSSSASASEMLAAALQDHRRAWIAGEVTFGKGSTQGIVVDSENPNLRLVYTISRYYRPSGAPLQMIGVTPDFIVPFERGATPEERRFLREADIFGNRLEREAANPWIETRPEESARVQKCLDRRLKARTQVVDFQRATALGVLRCTSPRQPNSAT